jgi:transglutaminase-like putative cysteine protease
MKVFKSIFIISAVVLLFLSFTGLCLAFTEAGILKGPGDSYTFAIDAGNDTYLEIPFTYPKGSVNFWVKVVGQDGSTVIGDFDLDNGEIINLNGGGQFYLTIYSKGGSGRWSATYTVKHITVKPVTWADVDATKITRVVNGEKVTLRGHLNGPEISDVVYLLSDSKGFTVNIGKVASNSEFYADLFEGDGKEFKRTYNLKETKTILPGVSGGFFLRVYAKKGAGDYEISYIQKTERLLLFTNHVLIENKSTNTASKVQLWVPVIETFAPYQEVLESSVNVEYKKIETDQYGNKFYYFEFNNFGPRKSISIDMTYKIVLKGSYTTPDTCEGDMISDFLKPERLVESGDSYIKELAHTITLNDRTSCEKAESIYRYVWENMKYVLNEKTMEGALKGLKTGVGDCNEFTDAIMALSRASGIPARKGNGYVFFTESDVESHAFPEVFLPGMGWTLFDATMYCNIQRPPIYIYAYIGEDPSYLREPDIEDSYFRYYFNGTAEPNIECTQSFSAKVL